MPVIMTGSPGGTQGGNSGSHFGSGLTALTTAPTGFAMKKNQGSPSIPPGPTGQSSFTAEGMTRGVMSPPVKGDVTSLEVWNSRYVEDKAIKSQTTKEYQELSRQTLDATSTKAKAARDKRQKDELAYQERQRKLAEGDASRPWQDDVNSPDKAAQRQAALARKEALKKPTLGDPMIGTATNRALLEEKSILDEDKVRQFFWPTEKKHPFFETHGVGAEHEEAMLALPYNATDTTVQTFVDTIVGNSRMLTAEAVESRKKRDAVRAEAEEQLKKEREEAAEARRNHLLKKEADAKAAAFALSQKIKKEMAEAAKLENQRKEQKAHDRFEKAQAQRKENMKYLELRENDDLRSEAEIANERREGSSMNKGGRGDYRSAMLEGNAEKMETFM